MLRKEEPWPLSPNTPTLEPSLPLHIFNLLIFGGLFSFIRVLLSLCSPLFAGPPPLISSSVPSGRHGAEQDHSCSSYSSCLLSIMKSLFALLAGPYPYDDLPIAVIPSYDMKRVTHLSRRPRPRSCGSHYSATLRQWKPPDQDIIASGGSSDDEDQTCILTPSLISINHHPHDHHDVGMRRCYSRPGLMPPLIGQSFEGSEPAAS